MGKGLRLKGGSLANNGGIMGSGIYGMFGSTVVCNSTDTSFYCSMTKFVNQIFMFLTIAFFVLVVLYVVYYMVLKPMMKAKRG